MQAGFAIIASRALDERKVGYMRPAEVKAAAEQGVEICSHSYTHQHMVGLDDAALEHELKDSKDAIEAMAGRGVTTFCVPFSQADERVIAAAEKHYDMVRIKEKKFTPLENPADGKLVYSFGLKNDTTFDEVKALIDKAVAEKAWLTIMLHGVVKEKKPEQREFEIDAGLLRQTLGYIKGFGCDRLMPVNFADVRRIRAQRAAPAHHHVGDLFKSFKRFI
jgi:peptidoglycan/xylan/chitin deacetylase (PgdA/CDA1 family)